MHKSVYGVIGDETNQTPSTRLRLFKRIEKELSCPVVTFFTSFSGYASIDDTDADMLQDILQRMDLSNGFALMISSLGGDGIAAERIVNVCCAHSGTGQFTAIVPGKAKSAATVICMGAEKIYMAPASELGPVDPQIMRIENGQLRHWSAYNLVSGYKQLFKQATVAKGNLEPYLQQLSNYDQRDITTWESIMSLSEDIAVKILQSGQMSGRSKTRIKQSIKMFLDPKAGTKTHGRPIYCKDARKCGLKIEDLNVTSNLWRDIYELYLRTDRYVSIKVMKSVECTGGAFYAPMPKKIEGV